MRLLRRGEKKVHEGREGGEGEGEGKERERNENT
jgi:hypothetical protein